MTWIISKALMKDYANSHCSQEPAAESSEESCSDGEQYAPLNVISTPHPFWHRDKTTDVLSHSLFGPMSKHLEENHGEDVLTWFQEGFPARTYPQRVKAPASVEAEADCGEKWHALSVKFDPASCGWKTHHCLFQEGLDWSCLTLPAWGMMQDGELWEAVTLEIAPTEKDYGYTLMRPIASEGLRHQMQLKSLVRSGHQDGNLSEQLARVHQLKVTPECCEILMNWPEGWTDLDRLEMDKIQQWLNSHGSF